MSTTPPHRRSLLVALSVLFGVGVAATGQLLLGPVIDSASATRPELPSAPEPGSHTASSPTSESTRRPPSTQDRPTVQPTTTSRPASPTSTPQPNGTARTARQRALAARVFELVNQHRADAGCAALRTDDRLVDAAQAHSEDMTARNYLAHTSPDGVTFDQRIRRADHPRPGAENIAKGPRSAEQAMRAWMRSPGHRANILNCSFHSIGIGVATNGWYWTQNFGY